MCQEQRASSQTISNGAVGNQGKRLFNAVGQPTVYSGSIYPADGMRVSKACGLDDVATRYRHDGQMGFEDEETDAGGGGGVTTTRYGLGARGVDLMERTQGTTATVGFPLYDAHGNNVATLSRSGAGYAVGDRRSYDAWGVVRSQQSAGDPKLRYCANLGHKADDESGLVYMRARYYEPTSGRFVSEDPAARGQNWFSYSNNDPVSGRDYTGKDAESDQYRLYCMALTAACLVALTIPFVNINASMTPALKVSATVLVCLAAAFSMGAAGFSDRLSVPQIFWIAVMTPALMAAAGMIAEGLAQAKDKGGIARVAVTAVGAYSILILGMLADLHSDED